MTVLHERAILLYFTDHAFSPWPPGILPQDQLTRNQFNSGFPLAFWPRWGKMRLYRLLGGGDVYLCKACGKLGHAPPGNLDFGPFIKLNLVKSGTVLTQT